MTVQGNYLAAYRLHGLLSLPEGKDVELLVLSEPNTTVILTTRPDEHCLHLDRQGTIAAMALNGILGRSQGDASALLNAGMRSAKEARDKQGTGVFLILNSTGDLGETNFTHRGERDEFVVCFDAFSKTALRDRVKPIIDSALAAVSLSLDENRSRDVTPLGEVTYAIDPTSQKPIYSFSMQMTGNLTVRGPLRDETLESIRNYVRRLVKDEQLGHVVRLLTYSHVTKTNILQSFLEAWAALEIFINASFKRQYEQIGCAKLTTGGPASARAPESLSGKFRIISSILDGSEADADSSTFIRLNKIRNTVHTGKIVETMLPVETVQNLLRKDIRLHVDYHAVNYERALGAISNLTPRRKTLAKKGAGNIKTPSSPAPDEMPHAR